MSRKQDSLLCENESFRFPNINGIPDLLLPHRRQHIQSFLEPYEAIRRHEGWAIEDPGQYLALPRGDRSLRHWKIWHLRARSLQRLLRDLEIRFPRADLEILDLGAGNGWLSHRFSVLGHSATAVDISADSSDGLGAALRVFGGHPPFTLVRAEYDLLPFGKNAFDVIVLNASLHYSPRPLKTLNNLRTFLKPGGAVYVMDTPFFHASASGEKMARETKAHYAAAYGIQTPDWVRGYLEFSMVQGLSHNLAVEFLSPHFGFPWTVRGILTRVRRGRAPAAFPIVVLQDRS